jgi:hypothetical protein
MVGRSDLIAVVANINGQPAFQPASQALRSIQALSRDTSAAVKIKFAAIR